MVEAKIVREAKAMVKAEVMGNAKVVVHLMAKAQVIVQAEVSVNLVAKTN